MRATQSGQPPHGITVTYAPGGNLEKMPKAARALSLAAGDLKSYSPPSGGGTLTKTRAEVALGPHDDVLGFDNKQCSVTISGGCNTQDCSASWGDALHRVAQNFSEVAQCKH